MVGAEECTRGNGVVQGSSGQYFQALGSVLGGPGLYWG